MSFLDTLRQGTDSTMTRVLIGLVGVAFIVGIGGSNNRDSTDIYAVVDGQAITRSEFEMVMRQQTRQARRNLSDAERLELESAVMDDLIVQEVLLGHAKTLHIGVSDDEVARYLKAQDAFHKDGKFEQATYEHTLREQGFTAERFEENLRRSMLLRKVSEFAEAGVTVSEAEVHTTWEAHATEFDLQYVRLPMQAFLDDVAVSDAERDTFIAANKDAIKKRYDQAFETRYNLPKRYTLAEIVLRTDVPGTDKAATRAKADEIAAKAAAGANFAELARIYSEDLTASSGGNLGQRAPAQLDPVLLSAADAAGPGKVSPAVETGRGFEIVSVQAIEDARVIPLEEAEKDLATSMIREAQVGDVQRAYAARIVEAWTTTQAVPRDLTEPRKLAVDETGAFSLDSQEIPGLGMQPTLRAALATAKEGDVLPMPIESKGTLFVVRLTKRTDPTAEDYAVQKDGVRAGLLAARQQDFFDQWKSALVAEADVTRNVTFKKAVPVPAE